MKDPAFLFYSQDFLVGTYEMTDAQVGQYIRLLCLQHAKGHLKESLMIATMGGKLDEAIVSKFLMDDNGHYFNERLDQEVNRRKEYSNSRRNNRNKATPDNLSVYLIKNDDDGLVKIGSSNNPERRILELKAQLKTKNLRLIATIDGVSQDIERELHAKYTNLLAFNEWYRLNDMTVSEIVADYDMCHHMIDHMETENETITTNKIPNLDKTVPKKGVTGGNKKKKQNNTGLSAEAFDRFTDFWDTYPKKVAKATAIAAFKKLAPEESLMADMLIAIEKQKKSTEWIEAGGKYIPHPSTWLNQKRWEDQLTEVTNGQSGTGSGVHQSARTPAESRFAKFGDPI